ncbi:hypothetical protein NMG60_11002766 [Bertholletia excelsa]
MSSLESFPISNSASHFDLDRWVIQVRRTLDEELEEDSDIPVSIFNVPKNLMVKDPHCYIPQEIALGPYHYWRPELFEMQRNKIAAVKVAQIRLQKSFKFHDLVDHLSRLEARIRACYHKYLDFSGETLLWVMAIDASFLLEFLQIYTTKEDNYNGLTSVSSRLSHLLDVARKKSAHNSILRDIVMLENQVPLFLLRKVLELQFSSMDLADELLFSLLVAFSKELIPFKKIKEFPNLRVMDCAHLLDVLYHMIVPKSTEVNVDIVEVDGQNEVEKGKAASSESQQHVKQLFDVVWKLIWKLNARPVRIIKKALSLKPIKVILKLPWRIITNLPGLKLLKPLERIFSAEGKTEAENENTILDDDISSPPLSEEIEIPSVSELSEIGVQFLPTNSSIKTISFDVKRAALHLPTISLEANTEAILKNLVAYETSKESGQLVLTRYTELMAGLIDTEDDVKLLRERGVILNYLKSDKEVADLWNGMSRSFRATKVTFVDKMIEDVNKYYGGKWKVKVRKFIKLYLYSSWKFLTLMAAVLLLLLMFLQTFCSVYDCKLPVNGSR